MARDRNDTIRRAIEIRDGVVQNERILSFQGRAEAYPHHLRAGTDRNGRRAGLSG